MVKGRSGRPWNRIRAKIQAETTSCWRCGKWLSGELKWPHPNSVTVGHVIALEDCERYGIDPEDITNLRGECIACNMRDGQKRATRARLRNQGKYVPPTPGRTTSYTNPRWISNDNW